MSWRRWGLAARSRLAEHCVTFCTIATVIQAPWRASAAIAPPGFWNSYYQGLDYNGSRVLEHRQAARFSTYLQVRWTQAVTLDPSGRAWLVDRGQHSVSYILPATRYVPWPALNLDYAGVRGVPGDDNGSRLQAKFNSPTGIAVTFDPSLVLVVYVADSNNHIIRKITRDRVATLVGLSRVAGLVDGPTKDARLRFPQSLGLDQAGNNLMVLDNERRVRHVRLDLPVPTITTLVDGACRSISRQVFQQSIIMREVGCHVDWLALDTGDTSMQAFTNPVICLGHRATCGPRHHPALADRFAPQLVAQQVTTTTSTLGGAAAVFGR